MPIYFQEINLAPPLFLIKRCLRSRPSQHMLMLFFFGGGGVFRAVQGKSKRKKPEQGSGIQPDNLLMGPRGIHSLFLQHTKGTCTEHVKWPWAVSDLWAERSTLPG